MHFYFKKDVGDKLMPLCRQYSVKPTEILEKIITSDNFESVFIEAVELLKNEKETKHS